MTTMTKAPQLVPFTDEEKRAMLNLAHGAAIDSLHEAQQTIAWLEGGPDRMSARSLLRGHRRAWMDREERRERELASARETVAKRTALVEKLEAVFAVADDADIEQFAQAMAGMWRDAKAADRKARK
jgi:hypothetical protein